MLLRTEINRLIDEHGLSEFIDRVLFEALDHERVASEPAAWGELVGHLEKAVDAACKIEGID